MTSVQSANLLAIDRYREQARSHRFQAAKYRARHLKSQLFENRRLAGPLRADAGGMAFSCHELSAQNAVIPFSLSLLASFLRQGPATFEMEHPYR